MGLIMYGFELICDSVLFGFSLDSNGFYASLNGYISKI